MRLLAATADPLPNVRNWGALPSLGPGEARTQNPPQLRFRGKTNQCHIPDLNPSLRIWPEAGIVVGTTRQSIYLVNPAAAG